MFLSSNAILALILAAPGQAAWAAAARAVPAARLTVPTLSYAPAPFQSPAFVPSAPLAPGLAPALGPLTPAYAAPAPAPAPAPDPARPAASAARPAAGRPALTVIQGGLSGRPDAAPKTPDADPGRPVFDGAAARAAAANDPVFARARDLTPVPQRAAELQRLAKNDHGEAAREARGVLLNKDERVEVMIAALRALQSLPAETAGPSLLKVAADAPNWYARREAALALGRRAEELAFMKEDAAPVLNRLVADKAGNASVRLAARDALARFGENAPAPDFGSPKSASKKSPWPKRLLIGGAIAATLSLGGWFAWERWVAPRLEPVLPAPTAPSTEPAPSKPGQPITISPLLPSEHKPLPAEPTAKEKLDKELSDLVARRNAEEFPEPPGLFGGGIQIYLMGAMVLLMAVSVFFMLFGSPGSKMKKRKAKEAERSATRFTDVAGADDAMIEVREVVDYLKDPAKYAALGGRAPKGVLLEGPPGTGKTLLARAMAGEAGANFFVASGSDFVEIYVGQGASRVRSLFDQAKAKAPAILFIDEIDAVGKQRQMGQGALTGNDEREQTLNAMLSEMDGFEGGTGVIVIAATNRADMLDQALRRAGRFDRTVHVGLPDVLGREAILQVHGRKARLGPDADLALVARRTAGLSGAFLENVINEAAMLATRRGGESINARDLDEAVDRATIGQRRHLVMPEEARRRTAAHESGHVIAGMFVRGGSAVNKVTIVPHGSGALGFAETASEDKPLLTESELKDRLVVLLGGLAAERLVFGEHSTGPYNDLERATAIARHMVEDLGMSEKVGRVTIKNGPGGRGISERTARLVDLEVKRIVGEAEERVNALLAERRAALDALSAALLERETLLKDEIEAIARGAK